VHFSVRPAPIVAGVDAPQFVPSVHPRRDLETTIASAPAAAERRAR
jgi:hypothetical protein